MRSVAESQADQKRPRRAYLNVARRCNARCIYCDDWKTDKHADIEAPAGLMHDIVDDLKAAGVGHVTLSGGEPLIRRDLWGIIDHVCAAGLSWSIISNGSMLNTANAQRLAARRPDHINVSMDTLDSLRLRQIRGLRAAGIIGNVLALQQLMQAAQPPIPVSIIAVVSRHTIADLCALADFCARHRLGLSLQPMHPSDGLSGPDRTIGHVPDAAAVELLEAVLEQLIARRRAEGLRLENSDAYLRAMPRFFRDGGFHPSTPCRAGAFDIVVDADLAVRPCWAMPAISRIDSSQRLTSILAGDAYRQVGVEIRAGHCPGCLYACHLNGQLFDAAPCAADTQLPNP